MHFITGISLGLVIGGSVVYFTQNTNAVRYPLEVSQNTIESIVGKVISALSPKQDSTATTVTNYKYKKAEKVTLTAESKNDSLKNVAPMIDSTAKSMDSDTVMSLDVSENYNENVKKDELDQAKIIEVVNISYEPKSGNKDSLLSVISGVQIDKQQGEIINLYVEFWKSPLNYKGYKLGKNKLIIYGISPEENLKMIYLNDQYFLKLGNNSIVKLSTGDDFKNFEKVTNPSITNLFNQYAD